MNSALMLFSSALIKHSAPKQLGEEGLYFILQVSVHHGGKSRQELP